MRVYLLPISTRRTFLYAQRLCATRHKDSASTEPPESVVDRITSRAARIWYDWEHKPSGWQRKVVDYGNHAFRRIPYEEWGLKSVTAAMAARNRRSEGNKVQLVFPGSVLPAKDVEGVALKLATERLALHRSKIIWCLIGMPLTAPFMLIPIVPNLPFFYLVYRAWSHWRAVSGGKSIQNLVENKLVELSPSPLLDQLYQKSWRHHSDKPQEVEDSERMLLTRAQVRDFCETLDVPALEIELERAIWQVEKVLREKQPTGTNMGKRSANDAEAKERGTVASDRKRQ